MEKEDLISLQQKKVRRARLLLTVSVIIFIIVIISLLALQGRFSSVTGSAIQNQIITSTPTVPLLLVVTLICFFITNFSLYKMAVKDFNMLSRLNKEMSKTESLVKNNYSDEMRELVMTRNRLLMKLQETERKIKKHG